MLPKQITFININDIINPKPKKEKCLSQCDIFIKKTKILKNKKK